jgi:hypothetical protein
MLRGFGIARAILFLPALLASVNGPLAAETIDYSYFREAFPCATLMTRAKTVVLASFSLLAGGKAFSHWLSSQVSLEAEGRPEKLRVNDYRSIRRLYDVNRSMHQVVLNLVFYRGPITRFSSYLDWQYQIAVDAKEGALSIESLLPFKATQEAREEGIRLTRISRWTVSLAPFRLITVHDLAKRELVFAPFDGKSGGPLPAEVSYQIYKIQNAERAWAALPQLEAYWRAIQVGSTGVTAQKYLTIVYGMGCVPASPNDLRRTCPGRCSLSHAPLGPVSPFKAKGCLHV